MRLDNVRPPPNLRSDRRRSRPGLRALLLSLALAACALTLFPSLPEARAQTADEPVVVPYDWPLIPADLQPVRGGEQFRLLAVTATGTSGAYWANIGDLTFNDGYVQQVMRTGSRFGSPVSHDAIVDHADGFRIVASSGTVDARDHTGTNPSSTGVPIYWLNGGKVADNNADFWDGSWDTDLDGGTNALGQRLATSTWFDWDTYYFHSDWSVWTGTNLNGGTRSANPMGSSSVTYWDGQLSEHTVSASQNRPILGISVVFEVGTVPPLITVTPNRSMVRAGQGAWFTIHADPPPTQDVVVRYLISDSYQAATARGDDAIKTVVIRAGSASVDVEVGTRAPSGGSTDPEPPTPNSDEGGYRELLRDRNKLGAVHVSLKFDHHEPADYRIGDPRYASIDVHSDSFRFPTVQFAEATSNAAEGDGTANVRVEVDWHQDTSEHFMIRLYYTVGGTATKHLDYRTSDWVFVPAGQEEVLIPVTIVDDAVEDSGETVVLEIFTNRNSQYAVKHTETLSHTITILNDESELTSQGTVYSQQDSNPNAALIADVRGYAAETRHGARHIERWNRVLEALGVDTGTGLSAMTASEAQTYADRGWPRWVPVVEELQRAEAATREQEQQQTPPTPEISIGGGSDITEGGNATFTLTASPAPDASLSVSVTVSQSGSYGVTTGTRTVTIGTSGTATLTVATTGDATDEPEGSVTATLASGTGYTLSGSQGSATVTVSDDDDPQPEETSEDDLLERLEAAADAEGFSFVGLVLRNAATTMQGTDKFARGGNLNHVDLAIGQALGQSVKELLREFKAWYQQNVT